MTKIALVLFSLCLLQVALAYPASDSKNKKKTFGLNKPSWWPQGQAANPPAAPASRNKRSVEDDVPAEQVMSILPYFPSPPHAYPQPVEDEPMMSIMPFYEPAPTIEEHATIDIGEEEFPETNDEEESSFRFFMPSFGNMFGSYGYGNNYGYGYGYNDCDYYY